MKAVKIEKRILLIEIERRCSDCNQRVFVGLTREEAMAYNGFECTSCECWNTDSLTRIDVPDWWDELSIKPDTIH